MCSNTNTGATLKGRSVIVHLSDPWDLGESLSWSPLRGRVLECRADEAGGSLILRLEQPFTYKGTLCEYFVVQPRLEG